MPRSLLLFWSPFDCMPFQRQPRSASWVDRRFRHWEAFTLDSVLRQTEGEFAYWLVCDPANRAMTEPLGERIRDERVRIVYADEWPRLLRELPRAERYLLARLDSDDLYQEGVAANLLARPAAADYFQFNRGYAWDVTTGDLREWIVRSSPFYCRVHGEEVRRVASWEVVNHTLVRQRAQVLGPGHFLVTFHGANTSSRIESGKRPITGETRRRVLSGFGLGGTRRLAGAGEAPPPTRPDALVPYLAERVAARRVLALGDGPWARAARQQLGADPGLTGASAPAYDLVVQDVAERDARARATREALRSVLPTGLVLLPHGAGAELDGWCLDRYPGLDGAEGHPEATLVGRVTPRA
jgi:Putative rhamnosyl transferase